MYQIRRNQSAMQETLEELSDESENLIQKALKIAHEGGKVEPVAFDIDPTNVAIYSASDTYRDNVHEGTFGVDYDILQFISRVPVISAILQTRINQIAEFCVPQEDQFKAGYIIRLKDQSKKPSAEESKEIQDLTRWLETCGEGYRFGGAFNFEAFIKMILRDSLTYDQACFEIMKNRRGDIIGFVPVDASTIRRRALTEEEKKEGRRDWEASGYIQIINGKKVADFEHDQLAFCIRRPRTTYFAKGYGFPELEELVRVVTHLVNAETYNASNFVNGIHAPSILVLKSKMTPQTFRNFKRDLYAMLSGAAQAKRTPIVQLDPDATLKEDLQSVNIGGTAEEMGYTTWIGYLTKLACALFQIDPAELGFVFGTEGQTGALTQQGPGARIQASKDKGLYPLLRSIQNWINMFILSKVSDKYELRFVGLDLDTEKDVLAGDIQRVSNYMTVNEIRAKYDLKPIEGGDIVLSQAYITSLSMAQQAQQDQGQQDQGDQGYDENQEDDEYNDQDEEQENDEPEQQGQQEQETEDNKEEIGKSTKHKFSIEI